MKHGLTNIAARGVDHLADLVRQRLRACQQQTDLLAGYFASTGMTLDPELPRRDRRQPFNLCSSLWCSTRRGAMRA
jgi:hypothetical protein